MIQPIRHPRRQATRKAIILVALLLFPIVLNYLSPYVIIEPGMKVGEVGEADPVRRDDIARAIGYAMTAEFFGMDLVYLEAGSGAPEPVPSEMIRGVKESIDIPLVVGGGVTSAEKAADIARAGADIVVTGTLVENGDFEGELRAVVRAVHEAR